MGWQVDADGVITEGRFKGSHTVPGSVPGMRDREVVWHRPVPPEPNDRGDAEIHPAWGLINVSRITSTPGSVLFDSDIRHSHFIRLTVRRASRDRNLKHDWIHDHGPDLIEVDMSEAQFGAMISSANTSGVPCTIRQTETNANVDGLHYDPRLAVSMAEVRAAADEIKDRLDAALKAVEEKPTKANIRSLRIALEGTKPNLDFAAKSLSEHAENVVQKARNDIESMVVTKAVQLGVDPKAFAYDLGTSEGLIQIEHDES
jgi:hypothetical protein